MQTKNKKSGFTLLELLIVIAIIAVLSVVLVLVLDPVEALKKSRDSQRMSDLSTLKTALGLYSTSTTTPLMGVTAAACKGDGSTEVYAAGDKIYYSVGTSTVISNGSTIDGAANTVLTPGQVAPTNLGKVDGTGWLPVNLSSLVGGSPISNMPIDPTNTVTTAAAPASTDLVYRYVCSQKTSKYEIDAVLESQAYKTDDNKMAKDGGNNANYYEVGTDLTLIGAGTDF
jgi:prepilin-type N-terminal cleavage/methylation domain-containing protein